MAMMDHVVGVMKIQGEIQEIKKRRREGNNSASREKTGEDIDRTK